ncbi:beta-N-acetylhexosaminidase [Methylocella silvestris]|uniref:beta-N-acetylhexosaminidase n=1 Tax=Methylocella silvestris TaxID=199596 RepID=A0A2J7TC20_METSI|nr:beta-N-acetylhexosaminidase [Methylocella silvestris]PNG24313.1 beta-N-acetylhexosaminidase [Methylocella silvestris]
MGAASIDSVGDHFFIGLRPTPVLDDRDRALLQDLRPAGVVLFKSNFRHDLPYEGWLASHLRLIEEIRAAAARPNLFISIDHEGGRVCRTPEPMTRYAYAAHWAQSAASVGRAMGRELASLGFNLNFAPVLDIHTNPANPVIGERAFGSTPDEVIAASLPFMRAMQKQGVLACGKHFPGHGDTHVDSHRGLPSQPASLDELRQRELRPFAAAIGAGVRMLMSSHISFPLIDPDAPVTLSRRFLTEILRQELGFKGVVVSDDIGMAAMKGFFDDPAAAARLIAAGSDMLMVCAAFTQADRARDFARAIVAARNEGRLDPVVLARSKARIAAMLAKTPLHQVQLLPDSSFVTHRAAGALFSAATVEVI